MGSLALDAAESLPKASSADTDAQSQDRDRSGVDTLDEQQFELLEAAAKAQSLWTYVDVRC